jgi:hypothetical protein
MQKPKPKTEPIKKPSPLREEVEQLKARKEELRTELASVTHKLEVLLPALRVMEGEDGVVPKFSGPVDWSLFDPAELQGLSLRDATVVMARFAGGTVNVKDIGELFMKYGLVDVKHVFQATAKAYTAMYSSDRFKKTGSGIFTLIGD